MTMETIKQKKEFNKLKDQIQFTENKITSSAFGRSISSFSLKTPRMNQQSKLQNPCAFESQEKTKEPAVSPEYKNVNLSPDMFKGPWYRNSHHEFNEKQNKINYNTNKKESNNTIMSRSKSNDHISRNKFKYPHVQNVEAKMKHMNHLDYLLSKNSNFLNKLKSEKYDQYKNKDIYKTQRIENMKEKDIQFTKMKNQRDTIQNEIFEEVRKSEEKSTVKKIEEKKRLSVKQVKQEQKVDLQDTIEDLFEEETDNYTRQKSNAERLQMMRRSSNANVMVSSKDYLRNINDNYHLKVLPKQSQNYDTDFQENFNWNFRDPKF